MRRYSPACRVAAKSTEEEMTEEQERLAEGLFAILLTTETDGRKALAQRHRTHLVRFLWGVMQKGKDPFDSWKGALNTCEAEEASS